jgi:tetratricopeptide (TPR) repeat protein
VGHIDRWLDRGEEAVREYQQAIELFRSLQKQSDKPEYRQGLAGAHNWLGYTLSFIPDRAGDAATEYNSALTLQDDLMRANASRDEYRQEAARTHNNRGILRFNTVTGPDSAEFGTTESDFREAIRLLEPLAERPDDPVPSLELARVYNNLGNLVVLDPTRGNEARQLYEEAIRRNEELVKRDPANRVYKMELATYCNNFSYFLGRLGQGDLAKARSRQALDLMAELALPAPSLGIAQADAHNVRGRLLAAGDPSGALTEYRVALEMYESRWEHYSAHNLTQLHERYQELLVNLARFSRDSRDPVPHALLLRAITGYLDLARAKLESGSLADTQLILENLSNLLPALTERDRTTVMKPLQALQEGLAARK